MMSDALQLGEIAFGEPLVNAGFGQRNPSLHQYPIFTLQSHPELVIRALRPRRYKPNQPQVEELTALQQVGLTEGLLRLDMDYGLQTPGFSMAREVVDDQVRHYAVTPRVSGFSFLTQLSEIPEAVAVTAFDSVVQYHEDYLHVDGIYLDDVRLPQLMYGRLPGKTEDQVYFIDVEQEPYEVSGPERESEFTDFGDQGAWLAKMLSRDIRLLERSYAQEFVEFRKRVGQLLLSFKEAFYEMNGQDLDLGFYGDNTPEDRINIAKLLVEGTQN